eukprot:SAG11_NODE_3647_length_2314_cov_4.767043_3_plen_127_part_01
MEFRARRDRWIHFLQGRINEGAGTSRGVAKEEGLLRRVLKKGMTLARAVMKAREQVACELAEKRELERLQELAMMRAGEMHQRLEGEAAERIEAVYRGTAAGARGAAAAGVRAGSAAGTAKGSAAAG